MEGWESQKGETKERPRPKGQQDDLRERDVSFLCNDKEGEGLVVRGERSQEVTALGVGLGAVEPSFDSNHLQRLSLPRGLHVDDRLHLTWQPANSQGGREGGGRGGEDCRRNLAEKTE